MNRCHSLGPELEEEILEGFVLDPVIILRGVGGGAEVIVGAVLFPYELPTERSLSDSLATFPPDDPSVAPPLLKGRSGTAECGKAGKS